MWDSAADTDKAASGAAGPTAWEPRSEGYGAAGSPRGDVAGGTQLLPAGTHSGRPFGEEPERWRGAEKSET